MDDIRTKMQRDHRCPDCGALLNDQPACGHCGWEPEPTTDLAAVIRLPLAAPTSTCPPWREEPQVA